MPENQPNDKANEKLEVRRQIVISQDLADRLEAAAKEKGVAVNAILRDGAEMWLEFFGKDNKRD